MTDPSSAAAAALSRVLGPLRRAVLRATRAAELLPDLPEAHIEILRTVADDPAISPRAIAEQLGLARPTVSNLIQRMRREGLLLLVRDDDDARYVHVTATTFATELLTRYDQTSERIVSAGLARLTDEERAAVTTAVPALRKLQGILCATDARSEMLRGPSSHR